MGYNHSDIRMAAENDLFMLVFVVRFWESEFLHAFARRTFAASGFFAADKRAGEFERELFFADAFVAGKQHRVWQAPVGYEPREYGSYIIVSDQVVEHRFNDTSKEASR